jgi:hypothetical protein
MYLGYGIGKHKDRLVVNNTNSEYISEIKVDTEKSYLKNNKDTLINTGGAVLLLTGFWTCLLFIILKKTRLARDGKANFFANKSNKIPCRKCRFYSDNNFLKCAVQPDIACTEDANNCTDYSPKNSSK